MNPNFWIKLMKLSPKRVARDLGITMSRLNQIRECPYKCPRHLRARIIELSQGLVTQDDFRFPNGAGYRTINRHDPEREK